MVLVPRARFPFPLQTPSWFVGHMAASLRQLPALLEDINIVIEARDARLPLTSVNTAFDAALKKSWGAGSPSVLANPAKDQVRQTGKGKAVDWGLGRDKIVVYTKRDLAEQQYERVSLLFVTLHPTRC
jgi:hypothetical protein